MTINAYLDLVKDALKLLPELEGIGVVVDHQQGADRLMDRALSKSKGYCVMLGEVSNRLWDKDTDGPSVKLKFGVTVYSPLVVADDATTGAALRDVIMRRLHRSKLQPSQHHYYEARYADGKVFIEKGKGVSRMIHATAFETVISYPRHSDLEA